ERSPSPTLTLIVSLEAIFLSTFVMISQNRADEKRQVLALAGVSVRAARGDTERTAPRALAADPRPHERDPPADRGAHGRRRTGRDRRLDGDVTSRRIVGLGGSIVRT